MPECGGCNRRCQCDGCNGCLGDTGIFSSSSLLKFKETFDAFECSVVVDVMPSGRIGASTVMTTMMSRLLPWEDEEAECLFARGDAKEICWSLLPTLADASQARVIVIGTIHIYLSLYA